jgi:hypothetical protein
VQRAERRGDAFAGCAACCRREPEGTVSGIDVLTEVDIERPVSDVATYAMDPMNAPEWYENIVRAEWRTEPPIRVGSVFAFEARFLGRVLAYDYEVVELIPDERFAMRTAHGPFPMETTYEWATASGGTHMRLRNRGRPKGFSRWYAPIMVPAIRRANRKDLASLKSVLEARTP